MGNDDKNSPSPSQFGSDPDGSLLVPKEIGLVFSGGGSRAAYQVGALKAIKDSIEQGGGEIAVVVGSSIGAVNGIILASGLKHGLSQAVTQLEDLWLERTFRNSFEGSPSMAFLRSIKMAVLKYARKPGPDASRESIFNPRPMMDKIDSVIQGNGGLAPADRAKGLKAVAVMTTIEGKERKPLLFVSSRQKLSKDVLHGASFDVHHLETLTAKHAFASAALPTVLPPVELDIEGSQISLVDGGISQNIPVDPAVRLGADRVIVFDISGRQWWFDRYGESHDKRPEWEIPAGVETFCLRPPETLVLRNRSALGPVLKASVGGSTRTFISALGPTWPIFSLVKKRLGAELAYEVLSYIALHPDYSAALIEHGYNETMNFLKKKEGHEFERPKDFKEWAASGYKEA